MKPNIKKFTVNEITKKSKYFTLSKTEIQCAFYANQRATARMALLYVYDLKAN